MEQQTAYKRGNYLATAGDIVQLYERTNAFRTNAGCQYQLPSVQLLNEPERASEIQRKEYAEWLYGLFREQLTAYGIRATVADYSYNDFAVIFRVKMQPGESVDKLLRLHRELDFEMRLGCPVEVMLSGEGYVVIGAKSLSRPIYPIRKLIESAEYQSYQGKIPIAMGVNLLGGDFLIDLGEVNNLLVVGTTGSGKSTFINTLILSLLYRFSPAELQMVLIDPKVVDLQVYAKLPHAVFGVVSDVEPALQAISWALAEAQARLDIVGNARCMSFDEYNRNAAEKLPRIVVVIDEYSDLMLQAGKELEFLVHQLSSRSLKSGVHLIFSTQRPSPDIVSPQIKSNIPCRASFTVVDKRESKMAVFRTGAERLLGMGDMIYSQRSDEDAVHIQAAYVSPDEADRVVAAIRKQSKNAPKPNFLLKPALIKRG